MRVSRFSFLACLVFTAGLMLGCGEGASKPMKGETVKPGDEKAKNTEISTKGGKKVMPGAPEGPEMPKDK
jgi:hypothetical protein